MRNDAAEAFSGAHYGLGLHVLAVGLKSTRKYLIVCSLCAFKEASITDAIDAGFVDALGLPANVSLLPHPHQVLHSPILPSHISDSTIQDCCEHSLWFCFGLVYYSIIFGHLSMPPNSSFLGSTRARLLHRFDEGLYRHCGSQHRHRYCYSGTTNSDGMESSNP